MNVIDFVKSFRPRPITKLFIMSGVFFLVFMCLDFFTTTVVANGDVSMEGTAIAALWWKIFGRFHHIDVLVWIPYVFGMAWVFNMKSELLGIWFLNWFGFGHVLGWTTWLPYRYNFGYRMYDALKSFTGTDWVYYIPLGVFALVFGGILALIQIKTRDVLFSRRPITVIKNIL